MRGLPPRMPIGARQLEGERDTTADPLLAHGALKGRPDERHGGVIQLNPTDDVLYRLSPEVGLRGEGLPVVHPNHPAGRQAIANTTAVVEPYLEDATTLERRGATEIVGSAQKADVTQAQTPVAGRLLDGGLIQVHELQSRADGEI